MSVKFVIESTTEEKWTREFDASIGAADYLPLASRFLIYTWDLEDNEEVWIQLVTDKSGPDKWENFIKLTNDKPFADIPHSMNFRIYKPTTTNEVGVGIAGENADNIKL